MLPQFIGQNAVAAFVSDTGGTGTLAVPPGWGRARLHRRGCARHAGGRALLEAASRPEQGAARRAQGTEGRTWLRPAAIDRLAGAAGAGRRVPAPACRPSCGRPGRAAGRSRRASGTECAGTSSAQGAGDGTWRVFRTSGTVVAVDQTGVHPDAEELAITPIGSFSIGLHPQTLPRLFAAHREFGAAAEQLASQGPDVSWLLLPGLWWPAGFMSELYRPAERPPLTLRHGADTFLSRRKARMSLGLARPEIVLDREPARGVGQEARFFFF